MREKALPCAPSSRAGWKRAGYRVKRRLAAGDKGTREPLEEIIFCLALAISFIRKTNFWFGLTIFYIPKSRNRGRGRGLCHSHCFFRGPRAPSPPARRGA